MWRLEIRACPMAAAARRPQQHKPEKCDKTAKQGDSIHVHYTGKAREARPGFACLIQSESSALRSQTRCRRS